MNFGEFELFGARYSHSISPLLTTLSLSPDIDHSLKPTHSKRSSTPRGTTTDFVKIDQHRKRRFVSHWDIDDAMMGERAHCCDSGALLPPSLRCRGDEQASVLSPVASGLPLLAGAVPEGFPLGGEVAVTRGNAEEEGVVFFKLVRGDEGDGLVLARSVHFAEDLLG